MNLKKIIISIPLAAIAVALIFLGQIREVQAEVVGTLLTNPPGSKFEVSLQTSFAEPPTNITCAKDSLSYATTGAGSDRLTWVCQKGSIRWQQVVEGDDGNDILTNYATLIYKFLAGVIGLVAVLMIVVGGIEIATAGANQNGLQSGKDRILAALVGLTILFLSSLILYTINPIFFTAPTP